MKVFTTNGLGSIRFSPINVIQQYEWKEQTIAVEQATMWPRGKMDAPLNDNGGDLQMRRKIVVI